MRTTLRTWAVGQILLAMTGWASGAEQTHTVLVEAEGFQARGGWVVDQQFMDQMGSPMLLAHGLGEPVADATTTIELPAPGIYHVLVRTRDWAAPWRTPGKTWEPPGKFQVCVDGKPLATTFGTEGAEWHWQDGGMVRATGKKLKLALHDLTGFDGRCDAIVLSTDAGFMPPNQGEALAAFRRQVLGLPKEPAEATTLGDSPACGHCAGRRLPEEPDERGGRFDLVVVGGGIAGTCAAISAARLGLEVALVQDRPVLGGNNSSEIRVGLSGLVGQPPYPALGAVVRALVPRGPDADGYACKTVGGQDDPVEVIRSGAAQPPEKYGDDTKLAAVEVEKKLHLFLDTHVFRAEKRGSRIVALLGKNIINSRELRFSAPLFADCTGDAAVGFLAGADYCYGRESRAETGESLAPPQADRQVMGASVMWYSVPSDAPQSFPDCPWAIQFNAKTYQHETAGNWNWETGFRLDQVERFELIRDHGLRAVYGNWAFQKNAAPDKETYARRKLGWVAYVGGKRESRRLLGDVILRQQDVTQNRLDLFPDGCVTATHGIDLHFPAQSSRFPGQEFRATSIHLMIQASVIPYRCLYSRNIANLFMAGRDISVTHVALGTIRVQGTTGMTGEVVGMAASLCKKHDVGPRQVYEKHLAELKQLLARGVGKPAQPAHR